jgi:hypothetical protein
MTFKNHYTAKEAQERLGIDEWKFHYLVKTGRIKKVIPPGRKTGVYPKSEIDEMALEMLAFITYDERQGVQFMKAKTEEDIQEEFSLATLMFGSHVHDIPTREAWLSKNPDTDFIVRDNGKLVAFINVLPVKHETIMRFMEGEIRGWDIPADDVLPYLPGQEYECIIMGMATAPDVEMSKRSQYGRRLIAGFLRFAKELAEKNITIRKFYATSVTPTGIAIMEHAGFEKIGQINKRYAFMLDTVLSDAWIAKEYRQILEDAKNHHASYFDSEQKIV